MSFWADMSTSNYSVTILIGLATCFFFSIIYNLYLHPLSRFPGPRLWQCSYLLRFRAGVRGELEASIKTFHERYGAVVRYSPGELSFTAPAAWRDIYGFGEHALVKEPSFYGLIHLSRDLSHSIFTVDSEQHPRVRKALSYAFSERALREQEPYVKKYVDLLIRRLHELAASTGSNPASPVVVDIVEWYNFTTFDIIGDLAIAQSFGCLRGSRYHEWVRGFWDVIKLGAIVRALAVSTYAAFPRLLRLLAPRSLKDARRRHLEYVGHSTEQRLAEGELREKPDFISYILAGGRAEQQQQEKQERSGGGAGLSHGEVEANANFLLLAGTETTATALAGVTYYLLKNRAALHQATDEVRRAFLREDAITFATTAADRLPYVQACLNEGLRIYPPGPIAAPRRTTAGRVTMIAGHAIPGDVTVGVHAWSASHSAQNFHRASEFHPERWLASSAGGGSSSLPFPFAADRRAAAQPFSFGPRNCLGKPFAYNEMRVILARMLWNFDLELAPESEGWEKQKVFTLWDKGPLMVKLSPVLGSVQERIVD